MGKPLININVPKVGRIKTRDVLYVAVITSGLIAAWNWSDRIPGVGKYAAVGKYYALLALGYQYPVKPVLV
jgi:hypothetical protein